jgi:thiol-disulfide isomerase/thioredoxin
MSSPLKDSVSVIRSRKTDRIDTLEKKLMNYYSEVDHPFFKQQLEYAVAQLRITPDCNRSKLFEASIKGRDIQYQSPEYVKFFKQFFHKHLLQFAFTKQPEMVQAAVKSGDFEQVLALMREHEFLHDEELAELVTLHELYLEWGNDLLSSQGIIRCLDYNSFNETLQTIAENMLWDRTEMQVGARLPDNLEPLGYDGRSVDASVLDSGYVYFAVTADWCTYCEQEINALEDLAEQYGNYVHFVVLDIATEVKEDDIGRRERASSSITEIHAGGDPLILDKLRIRSVPTFYLLLNGIIQQAPAVAPSQGIGREFHRITTAAKKGEKVKVWDN